MKNNMVKKLLTLALAGAMTLSLAACGSKSDDSSNDAQQGGDESGKTYKVAIIKQLDHASQRDRKRCGRRARQDRSRQ